MSLFSMENTVENPETGEKQPVFKEDSIRETAEIVISKNDSNVLIKSGDYIKKVFEKIKHIFNYIPVYWRVILIWILLIAYVIMCVFTKNLLWIYFFH